MSRIYDYGSFSSGKNKNVSSEMTFTCELAYLDVEVVNRPPEITDVDSLELEIEYQVSIERSKDGIQDLNFKISNMEVEIKVDDYPNDQKEFEFDLAPGENIPLPNIIVRKGSKLIPAQPTFARINMMKSMNTMDFRIEVLFGHDE
jgi:hypothetical protein